MKFAHLFFSVWLIPVIASGAVAQTDSTSVQAELITRELIIRDAPFKQCHASSLAGLPDGRIMAVWFGGTHERHPDVCIWGSVTERNGWSKPALLADGKINDTLRYPCWNPVLFRTTKGELVLFYKVGPSPSAWWGMFRKSNDDGLTWSLPQKMPEGMPGPAKNKPVCLPGGRIISPSSIESGLSWNAHMEISDDDGKTWIKVPLDTTTGYRLIQPALLILHDATLLALMRSDQDCLVESRSDDGGNTWSRPVKTSILNPNAGIDAVTLSNGLHLLAYNPAVSGKEWSDGRSKLSLACSTDGVHWHDLVKLEDHASGEYSYPAIIQTRDGLVHITYTSDRVNIRHVVLRITRDRA